MTISAIICAHNPDLQRLERVFRALEAQTLPRTDWECLVVDNASAPGLEGRVDMAWHPRGRVVREETLGLTHARLRGFEEAQGDILVLVDDDCLLAPEYLAEVARTLQAHPFLGALGGYGRAEYERPPPAWMNRTFSWFHLDFRVPQSEHPLIYARTRQMGPWTPVGAGMAIRRDLAARYADFIRHDPSALALDRSGSQLAGGGDIDLGIYLTDQGYGIGRSNRLLFTHIVPNFRLELDYMVRLLYMSQYSVARLLVHRGWKEAAPLAASSFRRKLFTRLRRMVGYSPEALCWKAFARGYADGLQGAPMDPWFCQR